MKLDNFLNGSNSTTLSKDKKVSTLLMIGMMCFQEDRNKELQWQDFFTTALCLQFWMNAPQL